MGTNSMLITLSMTGLILLSAFFSATEIAFSSFSKIRLKNQASNGDKKAALVLKLAEDYDRLLSTILIGNNIVNIAFTSLGTVLFIRYFGDIGATFSTVTVTIVILIFAEITPKSLAKEAPETFTMRAAPLLNVLIKVLAPINYLFSQWKKLLSKLFKVSDDRGITEEELLTIVDEAQHDGGINEREGELIRNVIDFDEREAIEVFTPRVDVVAVPLDSEEEEIAEVFSESGFSRIPVYEDSVDNIVGVLHHKDFHNQVIRADKTVASIMQPAVFVSGSMKIPRVLKLLQTTKSHLAVITDEYGGTAGIVTMEDILEELVGEIWDEHDEIIKEFEQISDNEYRIMASANIEDLFEALGINIEVDSTTIGGWVIDELGHIPDQGDSFDYENLTITVLKTDSRRILEVSVVINPPLVEDDQEAI